MPSQTFLNLPAEKQTILLNSAFTVFSEKPYEAVKVVHLSEAMGIPRVTFYSYFTNLADLYGYLLQRIMHNVDENIKPADEVEHILKNADTFLQRVVASDQGQKVIFEAMKGYSESDKLETHILLSLARQYQLKLLSSETFSHEYQKLTQLLNNEQTGS
ncbi:TetR/AcrR family transcriptional regulator [Vibrio sp. DNB22_10_4]